MAKKYISWKTKGMNRDLSVSSFNSEFSFENLNLRLSTNEGNTTLSWVNERGPKNLPISIKTESGTITNILGNVLGTAVIDKYLVLFVHLRDESDAIYRLNLGVDSNNETILRGVQLFSGSLNLTDTIETLVSYESANVQKVYWVDSVNQPRVINIIGKSTTVSGVTQEVFNYNSNSFDFIPILKLKEIVHVEKSFGNGLFPAGVIKYCFTYYNKNGQESNIFYTTPQYYISDPLRGGAHDENIANTFKLTISNVDTNFNYLRIYSILRTSINDVPYCKRLTDIPIKTNSSIISNTITFIDNGTTGDTIDPTELLFKNNDNIVAETLEQKDNTLFLGNIKTSIKQYELQNLINRSDIVLTEDYRKLYIDSKCINTDIAYYNTLSCKQDDSTGTLVPSGGFKIGNYYRCGIQFQSNTGNWSNPIYIEDINFKSKFPKIAFNGLTGSLQIPCLKGTLNNSTVINNIYNLGYIKIRPVIVFPEYQDKKVLYQGVVSAALYRETFVQNEGYQPSWFFRFHNNKSDFSYLSWFEDTKMGVLFGSGGKPIRYSYDAAEKTNFNWDSANRIGLYESFAIEIDGTYCDTDQIPSLDEQKSRYVESKSNYSFYSPDITSDTKSNFFSSSSLKFKVTGRAEVIKNYSDIFIETSSSTVSSKGDGVTTSRLSKSTLGLGAGLFYSDFIVKDYDDEIKAYESEKAPVRWYVYPWQADGSLNNDIDRPTDMGTRTAVLKKKILSNARYLDTKYSDKFSDWDSFTNYDIAHSDIFDSDDLSVLLLGNFKYFGNVDTVLRTKYKTQKLFSFGNYTQNHGQDPEFIKTVTPDTISTDASSLWVTSASISQSTGHFFYRQLYNTSYSQSLFVTSKGSSEDSFDTDYTDLFRNSRLVRMKYKSTPHLFMEASLNGQSIAPQWRSEEEGSSAEDMYALPVVDIYNNNFNTSTIFGGNSEEALKTNNWIPCGEPVSLLNGDTVKTSVSFEYSYGDTYFQTWDCLKIYPYTSEDTNQIVEIGSFNVETYTNIDGRYDKNRGLQSNINSSPRNFNLINPIYSQIDNFFTYKILDESSYKETEYPNNITWTLSKQNGADIDAWTKITLANTLELDGDKGKITALERFNNQLIAFQDKGVSQILYNENTQISTIEGVPIEIANSEKVQGKRYFSNNIGCSNKKSIANTPSGIYFIDSNNKSIYLFNGEFTNLSAMGFTSWSKQNIPDWTGSMNASQFLSFYDNLNQEILFTNNKISLAYSEKFNCFTSFYNYELTQFFETIGSVNILIRRTGVNASFWQHHAGDYCNFFGTVKPYSMTLIGNQEAQTDKIFTNLEFRACVEGEGSLDDDDVYTAYSPFHYIETWDEYQHGITSLSLNQGHSASVHGTSSASLNRKFRIWRCDIPRDNAPLNSSIITAMGSFTEEQLGITRTKVYVNNRIRNPWIYLKLSNDNSSRKTEIHDIMVEYFN